MPSITYAKYHGLKTYEGKLCMACQNRERFTETKECISCVKYRERLTPLQNKKPSGTMKPMVEIKTVNLPCRKCGSLERLVRGNNCPHCIDYRGVVEKPAGLRVSAERFEQIMQGADYGKQ